MLSNSSKYALTAVLYLAVNASFEHKIQAKDISEPTAIPKAYLAKILQELSKHHIVSSVKGPNGGFYLSEENRSVNLIKIVDLIDGKDRLTSCVLSLKDCNANHPCPLHDMVGTTKTRFFIKMNTTTIGDLVSDIKEGKSFLPL